MKQVCEFIFSMDSTDPSTVHLRATDRLNVFLFHYDFYWKREARWLAIFLDRFNGAGTVCTPSGH